MANISAIKLPDETTYNIKDNGALQLTGGQVTGPVTFGDTISIDDATIGDLVVNGAASFTNNIQANTINGIEVGSNPKFTDTITTVTTTGSGNAITAISATNGVITATKGTTFLTSYTETDPVFSASAAAGITATDISNWNAKTSNTGTVTSITLTQGIGISIDSSGTAITTSGSRTISLASITKNDTTSTASPAHGGTFTAVDSITYDTYGRVTGVNTKTVTLPSDNDTDEKVKQTANTTSNAALRVLFAPNVLDTNYTGEVNKSSSFTYNPSTKALLTGGSINGYTLAAASAKGVDTSISLSTTSVNLPTTMAVSNFVADNYLRQSFTNGNTYSEFSNNGSSASMRAQNSTNDTEAIITTDSDGVITIGAPYTEIYGVVTPTSDTMAANKAYVDSKSPHIIEIWPCEEQALGGYYTSGDVTCTMIKNWIDNGETAILRQGSFYHYFMGYDRGISDLLFMSIPYRYYEVEVTPYQYNNNYTNIWQISSYSLSDVLPIYDGTVE